MSWTLGWPGRLISLCLKLVILFSLESAFLAQDLFAVSEARSISLQSPAFAPNSGGQDVYSLRYFKKEYEYTLFSNQYLLTGDYPLTGVIMSKRYDVCGGWCPIKSFVEVGAGLSTGGPLVEVLWNVSPFWLFRIDVATHFYFIGKRAMVWSYPLWLGVSIPF